MKNLIYLFAAACMLIACNETKTGYTIKGSLEADTLLSDTVLLMKIEGRQKTNLDTALITNGAFSFEGVADSVKQLYICLPIKGYGYFPVFLENGNINCNYTGTDNKWTVSGTLCNDAYMAYKNASDSLTANYFAVYEKLEASTQNKEQRAALKLQLDSIGEQILQCTWTHIEKNIDNLAGFQILKWNGQAFLNSKCQELGDLLNRLPAQYANDAFVVKMKEITEKLKKTAVGQKFTDFEMQTPEGKTAKLSDFIGKGKVLFVDFWASWCGPCRASIPELKKIYAEYHPLGLEVLGVSFDTDAEAWEKAIKEEGLKWAQMSDLKGWDCVAGKTYAINSIPAFMMLDSKGTIISRERNFEKIRQKLDEILK